MNMFRAFMELDKLNESYYNSRQELIDNLKSIGRNYKFDKYTDEQLYHIWQKESEKASKVKVVDEPIEPRTILYCDECGTQLTDGGFCPVCDDGANDLDECHLQEDRTKSLYICSECGFETELYDDEFDGCCPRCHDHHGGFGKCEEFADGLLMTEALFDIIKDDSKYMSWISRTAVPNNQAAQQNSSQPQPMQQNNNQPQSISPPQPTPNSAANIVTIVYDYKAHKLRARADDGVHGEANVAFPNALRNREGQQYEVDELVWNGKNYRAIGNIVAI